MDFDELPEEDNTSSIGDGQAPAAQAAAPDTGGALPSFDEMEGLADFDTMPGERMDASMAGSFLRRGLIEAPVGLAAGVAGGAAGAVGAAAGALTSPVTGPVGPVAGALATGIPAAMYVGGKAHDLEDYILDKLGLREGTGFFSKAQEQTDRLMNPGSTWTGELAGNVLPTMGTGVGSAIGAGARTFNAGIQGALEAGQEGWNGEELNAGKILGAGAAGAVFAKPRGFLPGGGEAGAKSAPQGAKPRGPNDPNFDLVGDPYNNPGTDVGGARPTQGPQEPPGNRNRAETPDVINQGQDEVTPSPKGIGRAADDQTEFARQQRDTFNEGDPMWNFWNEHMNAAHEVEAQWGPPTDGEFTYTTPEDMSRANDVTTTSVGIAHDNSRAPEVRGAGNPTGAPMQARIAARPSDPGRDYRKGAAPPEEGGTTTGLIHPDVARAMSDEQLDAHIGKETQPEPPPPVPASKLDPLEQSQMQGDAMQRVQEKQAGMNGGEDYPSQPATAAVTPEKQAFIDQAKSMLKAGKMNKVLAAVDQLPPEQQHRVLTQALDLLETQRKADYDQGARPTVASGMTARSKADAARKQGVLDAHDQAVAEFGRGAEGEDRGAMMDRLGQLVRRTDELTAGNKYRPNEKPASYQLVQAARKVLSRPTPAAMDAYKKAELATVEGDKELAQTNQTERRINADIEKRPGLSDAALDAQASKSADTTRTRPEYERFDNSMQDESAVYKTQHDGVVDWLNSLSDENHKALAAKHPDLELNLKTTQDPEELHRNLLDDLAEAQRKNPPKLEWPAEDAPRPAKVSKITNANDVAASEGRRIDPNSAEGKAIAAAALRATSKSKPAFEDLIAAEREGAQDRVKPPVDGSDKSALEHWAAFMADEGGSIPLDKAVRKMADWMKNTSKDFFTPRADPATIDYGKAIGMAGKMLNTQITRIKQNALAAARTALLKDGTVPVPADMDRMYLAKENGQLHTLSQDLQDYWRDHVQPHVDRAGSAYDELRDISQRLHLPGYDEMPERKTNGAGFADWMPRRRKYSADDLDYDPITNRGLSNWAQSAQERDWFALQNKQTGERKIFHVNDDGNMVFYNNHTAGKARTPPNSIDPREIGSSFKIKAGSGANDWVVDHAKVPELEAHGNGEGGTPLLYSHNPVFTALDSYIGLKSALARTKLLENVLDDPAFKGMSTTRKSEAEAMFGKNNFAETILPQLRGRYLPKPMAWAFDDLVKTGFNYGDNTAAHKLASFTQATLKPFFFFGPQVHVFNELDKFMIGRGLDNVTPKGIGSLGRNFLSGLKSVRMQDATQAEIMTNGGNPMFAHALTARVMPQIGKLVGEDMVTKPYKYDPLMRAFGVNTKEVMQNLYQQSNKAMWWQSDVLYTTLYNEFKEKGLAPKDAVHETEKIIDSYVVPTTFGKSVGLEASDAGRAMQKFLTDPLTATFGRFHYGLFHTAANIVKNMLGPNSTPSDRIRGAGQAAMLVAMSQLVYPLLSKGYQGITGNEGSEFEKRGLSRLAATVTGAVTGTGEKDVSDVLRNVWSPSTILDTGIRTFENKDFTGKKIVDTSDPATAPGREAEFLAGQLVSPYKTLSTASKQGGPGWMAQRFAESNLGLKTPSDAAEKFELNREKTNFRNAKSYDKRPKGVIEGIVNTLTGR